MTIKGLKTYYYTPEGVPVKAVDDANLEMERGEALGLAGESGCGKSTLGLSILRLVRSPGRIVEGEILFKGENLLEKNEEEIRKMRGGEIATIFQDPSASLNPVFTLGSQIGEAIKLHQYGRDQGFLGDIMDKIRSWKKSELREKEAKILDEVQIPDPAERIDEYPHEFSGGMRQRGMIAMSLSCEPALLIADEPTTNLDVTIQARILDLMEDLKDKFNTAVILITHNLGVLSEFCDTMAVMYAGKIVEYADAETLFSTPTHPYAEALLESVPKLGRREQRLREIPGEVPSLDDLPPGCSFHPRCQYKMEGICNKAEPPMVEVESGVYARCFRYVDEDRREKIRGGKNVQK